MSSRRRGGACEMKHLRNSLKRQLQTNAIFLSCLTSLMNLFKLGEVTTSLVRLRIDYLKVVIGVF